MRPRTFILIFVVLLLLAAAVVLFLVVGGTLDVAGLLSNAQGTPTDGVGQGAGDAGQPAAQPTPTTRYEPVVVTRLDLPIGTRLTMEHLEIEMRPETNIAVQAGYTFANVEDVQDRIIRAPVAKGQAVLESMLALGPTDLAAIGSDLSLYVNQGQVAIAIPIDRYSGAAYATRPGDFVDILMSLNFVKIDNEFQTALPNIERRINPFRLEEGSSFLFEGTAQGRLEVIPALGNLVATIGPRGQTDWGFGDLLQIPRRVTQLTIQQAEVLWVGTWDLPGQGTVTDPMETAEEGQPTPGPDGPGAGARDARATPEASLMAESEFRPREARPDIIILSMTPQDALALKWALDRGVDIDLALRAQGDTSVFATTSVSLPQLVEQGGLTIPERTDDDLSPRADEVLLPEVPPLPAPSGPQEE